jgi:nanoRNase/pAp phosphatase (c-di-AMP/oligoRNAs hydrolase)
MLVVVHNNPDPDAIMSAQALCYLVGEKFGLEASIAYGGYVGRAENRTLVRILDIHLKQFNRIRLDRYDVIACVDTQPGAGNNMLTADSVCHIVIDHHRARRDTRADLAVIRTDLGGTATVLVEWLNAAGIVISSDLATGLAYAISSETQSMGRETSRPDIDAYLSVYVRANLRKLSKIMFPALPREYFVILARALRQAKIYRNLVCSHLGDIPAPEIVAEMTDLLVRHERTTWAFCTGRYRDRLILSLRSTKRDANAGDVIRNLVQSDFLAGGHGMIGGGYVPIGDSDQESLEQFYTTRFLELLGNKNADWKPFIEHDAAGPDNSGGRPGAERRGD